MKRVLLEGKDKKSIILFFCGWGLDENSVKFLERDCDVLVLYDYRDIKNEVVPLLDSYDKIYVVAWSMGVWAASYLINKWGLEPHCSVAINGTERPIDSEFGIHPKVYTLTEKGMDDSGVEKFFSRMFYNTEDFNNFAPCKPKRDSSEQVEELKMIRLQSEVLITEMKWDLVYISNNDRIFPVKSQINWWEGRAVILFSDGGHYPFYELQNWNNIIGIWN